jgi:hypothetical protein
VQNVVLIMTSKQEFGSVLLNLKQVIIVIFLVNSVFFIYECLFVALSIYKDECRDDWINEMKCMNSMTYF